MNSIVTSGAFAVLTQTGFDALAAAAPGHVEAVRRHLFDRLTSEQVDQLEAICDAMLGGLREDPRKGDGRASALPEVPAEPESLTL